MDLATEKESIVIEDELVGYILRNLNDIKRTNYYHGDVSYTTVREILALEIEFSMKKRLTGMPKNNNLNELL